MRCHLTLSQIFWDRIQPETFWLAGRKPWPATVFLIQDNPFFLHCQRNYVWLGWHHATYFVDMSQRSLDTWKLCFTVIISSHDFGIFFLWAHHASWRVRACAEADPTTYHHACVQVPEKILLRNITRVWVCPPHPPPPLFPTPKIITSHAGTTSNWRAQLLTDGHNF